MKPPETAPSYAHTHPDFPNDPSRWEPLFTPFGDGADECRGRECERCRDLVPDHGHLNKVAWWAARFASEMFAPGSPEAEAAWQWGRLAGLWHDLGKFAPEWQVYLRNKAGADAHGDELAERKDHSTAGAVLANEVPRLGALLSYLIAGHHAGLADGASLFHERMNPERLAARVRPWRPQAEAAGVPLGEGLPMPPLTRSDAGNDGMAFMLRFVFSCLVDADFIATEAFMQPGKSELRQAWPDDILTRMLRTLENHMAEKFGPPGDDPVNLARESVRRDCLLKADDDSGFFSLTVPTGGGKTLSSLLFALRHALRNGHRRVILVIPFTNIITQSVEVYRKALCLEGESPEEVVAEHHHQVEFKDSDIRHLTTTWRAPIIVTTAVQFFETLAANSTARLRKLHELPGSAVFLDEAHAALPASLWPVCWNWLTQWTRRWNGHLVLASGSLPEFWRMPEFRCLCEKKRPGEQPRVAEPNIPSLAPSLRKTAEEAEHRRVKFITEPQPLSVEELTDRIIQAKGPRIVVVNTVQSAAFLAAHLRDSTKTSILHLSTALTPAHRAIIVQRVKNLLESQTDWVLVATSLVEAGMDFSFFSGFRQRSSAASLIQLGGRVNRSARWEGEPFVLDFTFKEDKRFPDNPSLKPSQEALQTLFELGNKGGISSENPNDFASICYAALKAEFRAGKQQTAAELIQLEAHANYPEVAKQCRVIQSDTRIIVVDREIAERIKMRKPVSRLEITRNSVQMYHTKVEKLCIPQIRSDLDIYRLSDSWDYDPDFLGYMAEPFRLATAEISSGFYI